MDAESVAGAQEMCRTHALFGARGLFSQSVRECIERDGVNGVYSSL